jgi:leucyl aminopeptidase
MKVTLEARGIDEIPVDALALPIFQVDPDKWRVPARLAPADRALGGALSRVIGSGDFRGRAGEALWLYPESGLAAKRVLLVGLGKESAASGATLRRAAGTATREAARRRCRKLAMALPTQRRARVAEQARGLAEGAVLAGYRFDAWRTRGEDDPGEVSSFAILVDDAAQRRAARASVEQAVLVAECQNLARELSNAPGNALAPADLAHEAGRVAKEVGLRIHVMEVPELKRLKMGGILAVGLGSARPPRLIVLEHRPPRRGGTTRAAKGRGTVCLVGKGITFDSGGISIKPAASMHEMKHDMSGAAAVIGALRAAALLRIPLHVVGVIAAAENLPSGTAYRPGDVVRTMSGRTVEILNTDAEGRVVLADALHYARTTFEPEAMVDLATLTGACVIALGPWASGCLGNDERLVERVRAAGEACGERVWPLPLWSEHREFVRSRVGDLKNSAGREAGAITAGAFLSHFAEGTPWAHLDIAGTAWTDKADACQPPGATGVGVRLLVELLRGWKDRRSV